MASCKTDFLCSLITRLGLAITKLCFLLAEVSDHDDPCQYESKNSLLDICGLIWSFLCKFLFEDVIDKILDLHLRIWLFVEEWEYVWSVNVTSESFSGSDTACWPAVILSPEIIFRKFNLFISMAASEGTYPKQYCKQNKLLILIFYMEVFRFLKNLHRTRDSMQLIISSKNHFLVLPLS